MTVISKRPSLSADTFSLLWDNTVAQHSARLFLRFRDDDGAISEWTYGEFSSIVDKVAGRLDEHGVHAGDSVHLCLKNCPAFVALWLAIAKIGAWMVPSDPAASSRDIASQIGRVTPALGICGSERGADYRAGAQSQVITMPIVELGESSADVSAGGALMGNTSTSALELTHDPTDRLAVMFTSGTTSQPKGVVLTQGNYLKVATEMAEAAALDPYHRWFVTLPLFHANAQYYCFASAIRVGASVAMTASFSASRWVEQARELGVTHASLFAAPIRMILARTPGATEPLKLEHVWYAQNLAPAHHQEFSQLAGVLPRQLYGMTETIAIVSYDRSQPPRPDRIGRPLPGRAVKLLDPVTRDEVTGDVPGMIAVAGTRGKDLFLEYLDDTVTTSRSFLTDDSGVEWLLTGDLAKSDEIGDLSFVGRVDDVVKVSGENVSLTEVEAVIAQAPGVLEAAVIAAPDPIRDIVPHAYVVARSGANELDIDSLSSWAEKNLAPSARPRKWHIIDELPRTSVGKIRRFKIGVSES
ncbi:AMP-binding protein [Brevibacterium sp. RIT 803]|uniref:class I adenylate-forming enzyme family protein n=1 Tax=Brevibacterium sp. RIT 803 TaxID=2810210 RepID=UPI001951FDAA|nr:AMP-binding protein [Brevibacterium sp. RIT 803]MBM6588983.1 AMP-binding protein [Brevibacterium sp. RIT 803]